MIGLENLMCLLKTDKFWFILFQSFVVSLLILAVVKDRLIHSIGVVTRGEKSREMIINTFNIVLTIIISIIFQISTYPENGKVGLYILDLIMLGYLSFFNGWFINKIIGFFVAFEKRKY